jgi:hypothetical protein
MKSNHYAGVAAAASAFMLLFSEITGVRPEQTQVAFEVALLLIIAMKFLFTRYDEK